MAQIKVSTAYNRQFKMISSADHLSLKAGASPSVNISKNAAAFGAAAGAVSEVGNGWYSIALTSADTNTLGDLAFYVTGSGADDTDFADQVVANILGDTLPVNLTQVDGVANAAHASGMVPSDVRDWLGTAVTAATAGIPDVNTKNYNNVAATTDANNLPKVDVEDWKAGVVPAVTVTGVPKVDVADWLGTAVTAATAGIPDVNAKNVNNVSASSVTTVNANLGTTQPENFTGTGASAFVKVDVTDIAGVAVSTSTAQLGVNVVNIAGQAAAIDANNLLKVDVEDWKANAVAATIANGVPVVDWVPSGWRQNTAQAGAAGSITLDAGASATTDFFKYTLIQIIGGAGAGQSRLCLAYNGSTKVATVAPNWITNPDSSSKFATMPLAITDVEAWQSSAVPTTTFNGVPKVDVKYWLSNLVQTDVNNLPQVDVLDWRGNLVPATNVAGVPLVDVADWLGTAPATPNVAGVPKVDLVDWLGVAPPALLGSGAIASDVLSVRGTTINQLVSGRMDSSIGAYAAGQDNAVRRNTATGGNASAIFLDAGASATDNLYKWLLVSIISGVGAGQTRLITAYTGSNQTCTVAPNWTTTPDATSMFIITPWGRANIGYLLETIMTAATAGIMDVNAKNYNNVATATDVNNLPKVDVEDWFGAGVLALISGRVAANAQVVGDKTGYSLTAGQLLIKKNVALNNFPFVMTDSTTHAPKPSLTVSATRRIDNGAFAASANSVTEIGGAGNGNGWYTIDLAASDLNGTTIALRFTAAGADDKDFTVITQA